MLDEILDECFDLSNPRGRILSVVPIVIAALAMLGGILGAHFTLSLVAAPEEASVPTPLEPIQAMETALSYTVDVYIHLPKDIFESVEKEEIEDAKEPTYGFTDEEIYLLAQLLCGDKNKDGDGEYDFVLMTKVSEEVRWNQISLVLEVVMNRVKSDRFAYAQTVTDVVMARGQFAVMPRNASTEPHEIAIETVREWCEAYDRDCETTKTIPETHVFFASAGNNTNRSRA